MLLLNSLRGMHSTGALGVDKNGQMDYVKSIGGPELFNQWQETDKFMQRIPQRYHTIFGHGRFATKGTVNAATAHPFVRENTGMIHNGTMYNYEALAKSKYPKLEFMSDTDFCAQMIEDEGLEELIKVYTGGFAFMVYNKKDNQVQIARNADRPMFFLQPEHHAQWIFASEQETLLYIQAKFHIKGKVLDIASNAIYTFDIGDKEYKRHDVTMPRTYATNNSKWDGVEDYGDMCGYHHTVPRARPTLPPFPKGKNNVVPLPSHGFRLGDTVNFTLVDFDQRTLATGQIGTWIDGELITATVSPRKVAVVGLYYGVVEDIYEELVLTGEISEIIALDPINQKNHTRIFVKNIRGFKNTVTEVKKEMVEEREEHIIMGDPRVTLADGSTITEWRFKELVTAGCGVCQAKFTTTPNSKTCTLIPNPKGIMLGGPVLACPHCTANQVFDRERSVDHVQGQMH